MEETHHCVKQGSEVAEVVKVCCLGYVDLIKYSARVEEHECSYEQQLSQRNLASCMQFLTLFSLICTHSIPLLSA